MENEMPIDIVNKRIARPADRWTSSPPRLQPMTMIDHEPNTETIKDRPGIAERRNLRTAEDLESSV